MTPTARDKAPWARLVASLAPKKNSETHRDRLLKKVEPGKIRKSLPERVYVRIR